MPQGVLYTDWSPSRPGVSHLHDLEGGRSHLEGGTSGLLSPLPQAGEQSLVFRTPPQGEGTGTGPAFPLAATPLAEEPSMSFSLKLEPLRRRPITLFISLVAVDVARKLSALPS